MFNTLAEETKTFQEDDVELQHLVPYDKTDHKLEEQQAKFPSPEISDYIECQNEDHDISSCNVVQRIIHLLTVYQQYHLQLTSSSTTSIYEYLLSLKKYDVSRFMEDWYQVKKNHLKNEEDKAWIKRNSYMQCQNSKQCSYFHRHQRERSVQMYSHNTKQNLKDLILIDQLDSIHVFIFHSMNLQIEDVDENKYNFDSEQQYISDIWWNKPVSIKQCSIDQIVWILNNELFEMLKPTTRDKLINRKSEIIKYIEENNFDGEKLTNMNRKEFGDILKHHLKNKKLKAPLSVLHSAILKYNLPIETKTESKQEVLDFLKNNNKFMTQVDTKREHSKVPYYSFGQQYRYTDNLKEHPFYIQQKYKSFYQELCNYFERINGVEDVKILLHSQTHTTQTLEQSEIHPILLEIIHQKDFNHDVIDEKNCAGLWIEDEGKHDKKFMKDLVERNHTHEVLKRVITALCQYVEKATIDRWIEEADKHYQQLLVESNNQLWMNRISRHLQTYFVNLMANVINVTSHWISINSPTDIINHLVTNIKQYTKADRESDAVKKDALLIYGQICEDIQLKTIAITPLKHRSNLIESAIGAVRAQGAMKNVSIDDIKSIIDVFYEIFKIAHDAYETKSNENIDIRTIQSIFCDENDYLSENINKLEFVKYAI
eukprot:381171_1